jgi:hypothetical protein
MLQNFHLQPITETSWFFRNSFKVFIPAGIKALPGIELFNSVSGIIILAVLVFMPYKIKSLNKYRYYFGLVWFVLLMIPGMVFRTMEQDGFFYWDCRSYLPSIGLVLMISEIIQSVGSNKNKKLFYSFAGVYLSALAFSAFFMIKIYQSAPVYWDAVKSDYPDRFLPNIALYNYHIHYAQYSKAESELLEGVAKNVHASRVRKMLINFYMRNGLQEKAFLSAKEALDYIEDDQQFFIDNFISLSIETDSIAEIEYLILNHTENRGMAKKISESLRKEIEKLNSAGDTITAEELRQYLLILLQDK